MLARIGKRPCLETLEDRTAPTASILKDINLNPASLLGGPAHLTEFNGSLYFQDTTLSTGPELWKSDGTTAGTKMVKDFLPGRGGSGPNDFTNVNGVLFFLATSAAEGRELWKTDGTAAGTVLVKDITPGQDSSNIDLMTAVGNTLFFTFDDGVHGKELWKSDGTAAGTGMVTDIRPGNQTSTSDPTGLFNWNGRLYFSANDGTHGKELWTSDGTAAGTTLFADLRAGSASGAPGNFTPLNDNTMAFVLGGGSTGYELWKTDGTVAGTVRLKTGVGTLTSPTMQYLTNVAGTLFFSNYDSVYGRELWKSDGTAAGTTLVADFKAGTGNSIPTSLTNVNGVLYLTANVDNFGIEVIRCTTAGAITVLDVQPGNPSSNPVYLTNVNGRLFFQAETTSDVELWSTDATGTQPVRVRDIHPGSGSSTPQDFAVVNGRLFFTAMAGDYRELWSTNGVDTYLVRPITPANEQSSSNFYTNLNGQFLFTADPGTGVQLWKSNGTEAGTVPLTSWPANTQPNELTVVGNKVFFTINDGTHGRELWSSDGTSLGTGMVKDIVAGATGSNPTGLVNVNGVLYFAATDATNGTELWRSNGTSSGTVLVKDINSGTASSSPSRFTPMNGWIYFLATDATRGAELWKTDGTSAGTSLVKDINSGTGSSSPNQFEVVGNTLYFRANDGSRGNELWKSDGTSAGTVIVKDLVSGSTGSSPLGMTNFNGTLYFRATSPNDTVNGYTLWKSDGTSAGTTLIKEIETDTGRDISIQEMIVYKGAMYFIGDEVDHGRELWRSDGTPQGTALFKDIWPGPADSGIDSMTVINDVIYFQANDGVHGTELWRCDGTPEGTTLVAQVVPGSGDGVNGQIMGVGDTIYFRGKDDLRNQEVWKVNPVNIVSNEAVSLVDLDRPESSTAVTTVVATGSNVTYSISGGADAARFDIQPQTGVLTFKTAPVFAQPADANSDNVYEVTVVASNGSVSDSQSFDVSIHPMPAVTSVAPFVGPTSGGVTVVITGVGFTDGTNVLVTGAGGVKFGAVNAASYTVVSATQIVALAPPGVATVDVSVMNLVATSNTTAADQYTYATPAITSVVVNGASAWKLNGATWAQGVPTVSVTSTAGLLPGSLVSSLGAGFPCDAAVLSVDSATGFTLDSEPTATQSDPVEVRATNAPRAGGTVQTLTGATWTQGNASVSVLSTAGVVVGQYLNSTNSGLPPGAKISAIVDAQTLTLSAPATATQSAPATIQVANATAARDRLGNLVDVATAGSVVQRLLVTFNMRVRLDQNADGTSQAFSVTSLASAVTATGLSPASANVAVTAVGVTGSGNATDGYSQYVVNFVPGSSVNTFSAAAAGNTFTTIKDGVFSLDSVGSKIHAGASDTAADGHSCFWALHGAVNSGDIIVTGPLGDGNDTLLIDGLALNDVYSAFGSSVATINYDPSFDWNLDGNVDGIDLNHLYTSFGTIWKT